MISTTKRFVNEAIMSFSKDDQRGMPDLPVATRKGISALCVEFARSPEAKPAVIRNVLLMLDTYGPKQVLPVLLKEDALQLLFAVGKTYPTGFYGTVWVRYAKEETYVGAFQKFEENDRARAHGRGVIQDENILYIGDFKNNLMLGMGTMVFLKDGSEDTGYWQESLFEGTRADRRGDVVAGVTLHRDNTNHFAGPFVYTYASGEAVLGQKAGGRYTIAPSLIKPDSRALSPLVRQAAAFEDKGDWSGLFRWREAQQNAIAEAATADPALVSLLHWQPNIGQMRMLEDLLAYAPYAQLTKSPATRDFLKIMQHLQGPASTYSCQQICADEFHLQPWGHDDNQASFVARSMLFAGGSGVLDLHFQHGGDTLRYLFHQEHYEKPRQMFVSTMEQFLDGLNLAYRADKEVADTTYKKSNQVLAENLNFGPCTDGRNRALIESLGRLALLTAAVPEDTKSSAKDLFELSDNHLQRFRSNALTRYVQQNGGSVDDSVTIETQPQFLAKFFNIDVFMEGLKQKKPFSDASSQTLEQIRNYQLNEIGVLEAVS